jgi:HAD superfamily hydrolase (TIGR01450 family)
VTDLPEFGAYIFDLDGTIYLDDEPLPGAPETIAALRARGAGVAFVTNNPLHGPREYAARLTNMGIPATPEDVTTSVDALLSYLRAHHAGKAVLAIAEEEVRERLEEAGFAVVTDPDATEVVVVSFDRTFSYAKLHAAFLAIRRHGTPIVATNPDPYCPTRDGGLPDCAAMLAAVEACTGATHEAIVGKPSPHMVTAVLERLNVSPAETAVIGDRLMTDVAMGKAAGGVGILALSGATSEADLEQSSIEPDYVLGSIAELITS